MALVPEKDGVHYSVSGRRFERWPRWVLYPDEYFEKNPPPRSIQDTIYFRCALPSISLRPILSSRNLMCFVNAWKEWGISKKQQEEWLEVLEQYHKY